MASTPVRTAATTMPMSSLPTVSSSIRTPTRALNKAGVCWRRVARCWQTLIGGGSRGCKTPMVWTGWTHIMVNQVFTPTPEGAAGRIYLLQMGIKGPGSIERHGGYEDVYVKTTMGWRIKSRTHVRDRAWFNPLLQTTDLN